MQIKLNGERHDTVAHTIAELLTEQQAPAQGVAVAVNEQVISKRDHALTVLREGDSVELIRAVQGG